MIESFAMILCVNEEHLNAVKAYEWPAPLTPRYEDPATLILENYFGEENFENFLTGLAIYMVQKYPQYAFDIKAHLDNKDSHYFERCIIHYEGGDIQVTLTCEDYIFHKQCTCVDCGVSMSANYQEPYFVCPYCGASYALLGSAEASEADYVFGQSETTYSIPREEIDKA